MTTGDRNDAPDVRVARGGEPPGADATGTATERKSGGRESAETAVGADGRTGDSKGMTLAGDGEER